MSGIDHWKGMAPPPGEDKINVLKIMSILDLLHSHVLINVLCLVTCRIIVDSAHCLSNTD
jgi:hypothetical protein